MVTWEYTSLELSEGELYVNNKAYNLLGREGWELISAHQKINRDSFAEEMKPHCHFLWFRRPLQEGTAEKSSGQTSS